MTCHGPRADLRLYRTAMQGCRVEDVAEGALPQQTSSRTQRPRDLTGRRADPSSPFSVLRRLRRPLSYSSSLLLTGAFTGMRLSEVLGLSWDDVDFAAGVVHVRHQLARGRRGVAPHRIAPKTRASIREIPLLPQLAAVLRQHKRGFCFTRGSDYVFATGNGTAFLHHNVSKRVLRRAATGAGLDRPGRRVRFHDLRHTFASHPIIDIRLDVVQVSRILGHARTSMTLDTYTHLFEAARDGADVRAELAKSDFANLLARTSEPTARRGRAIGRSAGAATRGRVRVPACRPGRARTPSRSASPAPRPAAAASAPTYCAGHSRSARSPNDSCPSARPAAPG
jgi:integrase